MGHLLNQIDNTRMTTISEITREIGRLKSLADELWAAKMAAEKEPLRKWLDVSFEIDRLKAEREKLIEQMNSEDK